MRSSGTTARKAMLAAALVAAAAGIGEAPGSSSPAGGSRPGQATAARPARLLVPLRIAAPSDVDVADDGTVYATEPSTGRALAQHPDGSAEVLPFTGLEAPKAIAVADDGTVFVGDGPRILALAPDGTQNQVAVTGVQDVTALDVDPDDGSLLVADPSTPQVLRLADGAQTEVDLDGRTTFLGVAAGAAGDVLVVDRDADDVAFLHPDGTSDLAGLDAELTDPASVSFRDGTLAVAQPESIATLDEGGLGSVRTVPVAVAGGIAIGADGAIYATTSPPGTCRCPEGPGSVLRSDEATTTEITFGDVAMISAVSAGAAGTVVFTSTQGPIGYSDPNPVRRVVGTEPPTDVDTGGADGYLMAAAPDGTIYLSSGSDLVQVSPDGTPNTVAVPTEPGLDQVVGLAADEAGRLFVVLGSGYGSGAFHVVEPFAAGGAKEWYRSTDDALFQAIGAGGGTLQLAAITAVSALGPVQLLVVVADGTTTTRHSFSEAPVQSLTVDGAGVAYALSLEGGGHIEVVPPSGEVTTLAYEGERNPRNLAMGRDGTLYVDDAEVGLLALTGVGAATRAGPAVPTPAVPVAGAADYTG